MKKYISKYQIVFLGLMFNLFPIESISQQTPIIPLNGKHFTSFIPKKWTILSKEEADLNGDSLKDIVLAIQDTSVVSDIMNENKVTRILIILFKNINGYEVSSIGNHVLKCRDCGGVFGDPFEYIKIDAKKKSIYVNHYGGSSWRWSDSKQFRFQNENWFLIGEENYSHHNTEFCDSANDFVGTRTSINFITGKKTVKTISQENCKKSIKKETIKIKPLIKLSEIKIDN